MYKIQITIKVGNDDSGVLYFNCLLHKSSSPLNRLIDHSFYESLLDGIPDGEHYELELMEKWYLNHKYSKLLHIRTSLLNSRNFVCYLQKISDIVAALRVFLVWSIGTAFTVTSGKDFLEIYTGNVDSFIETMKNEYGIVATSTLFTPQ